MAVENTTLEDVVEIRVPVTVVKPVTKIVELPVTKYVTGVKIELRTLVKKYVTIYSSRTATVTVTRPVTRFTTIYVSHIVSYVATKILHEKKGDKKAETPASLTTVPKKREYTPPAPQPKNIGRTVEIVAK